MSPKSIIEKENLDSCIRKLKILALKLFIAKLFINPFYLVNFFTKYFQRL